MTNKSIRKRKQKQFYKTYLDKINDKGYRHYHCPTCFDNDNLLIEGKNINGKWICNKCNSKWIITA